MRYDPDEPQTTSFDPEFGIWHYAEPLPYYEQRIERGKVADLGAWVLLHSFFAKYRCHGSIWCSWPATEQRGECDRHGRERDVSDGA